MVRESLTAALGAFARLRGAAAVVLLAALLAPASASAVTSSLERAVDSVVAITSGAERIGTGVVVAEDRVLTAAHVIDAASGTPAYLLAGDAMLGYRVIAIDRQRDLALLEVDLPAGTPAIVWADSAELTRGQEVLALGFPIGLTSVSLTRGVVSSPLQTYQGVTFVQTDAAINPGNSGGPLVDLQGRFVGMSVAKIAQVDVDAVGFAVPVADMLGFLAREAPDIRVLMDTSSGDQPAEAEPVRPRAGAAVVSWPLAVLAAAAVTALGVLAVRRRRGERPGSGVPGPSTAGRTMRRAVFRVSSPGRDEEFDLRLPSVAGSAPNADIPLPGPGNAAYRIRFSAAPGGVTALDLADERGMYCGDACVKTASLAVGQSVRAGETTITFVRGYDA
ncbi:MAG: serine protease [Coriobacteriia bacterium]|nr:serine protease [Actinomycetota bacterium]MDZ4167725.1 serine protease [Coriobacteriia bacterium]